jgi:hypothetical protein
MVEGVVGQASTMGAAVVKNVFVFIFQTVIMIFTLFFIFRDGPRLAERVVSLIPMETAYKTHILGHRVTQTLTAVVRGMFLTASVQGLLAGIGFLAAGVQFSVVLGFATAFLALIPFVGAAAVWGPRGNLSFSKGIGGSRNWNSALGRLGGQHGGQLSCGPSLSVKKPSCRWSFCFSAPWADCKPTGPSGFWWAR